MDVKIREGLEKIESALSRIARAKKKTADVMARQRRRLEQNRRHLDWLND